MNYIFLIYKRRNNVPITAAVPLLRLVDPLAGGGISGALVEVGVSSIISQMDPNFPAPVAVQALTVHFPSPAELPTTQSRPVVVAGCPVAQQPRMLV